MFFCVCKCAFICIRMPGFCKVILIKFTSRCPILGEREVRNRGGWERERAGAMRCNHPSHEQQSDQWFPAGVGCFGRPAAQAAFHSETTESINSACKRIMLLEWRTVFFIPCPQLHFPSILCSPFFFFLAFYSPRLFYTVLCVACVVVESLMIKNRARHSRGHVVFFLVWLIHDVELEFALWCDLLS